MKMLRITSFVVLLSLLFVFVTGCDLFESDSGNDSDVTLEDGATLKLYGTIKNNYIPGNPPTVTGFTHATGTNYLLVDEADKTFIIAQDTSDDSVLDINAEAVQEEDLYTTSEYSSDLTFSDTSVKLLQAVIITSESDYDAPVCGVVNADPLEYYTYIYSSGSVTITGTDSTTMAQITYDNVELEAGWNILHAENPMDATSTISNGQITSPAWFMINASALQ